LLKARSQQEAVAKHTVRSLSKDQLLGKDSEISFDITAAAKQQMSNTETIRYNNNGSHNREQLNNMIQQQMMVFYAARAEAVQRGPAVT
jgi:hypothetical protein